MIFTKKELIEALAGIPDDNFIMIQVGRSSHPIIGVDDSTAIGFWEIKCDLETDFWNELERNRGRIILKNR